MDEEVDETAAEQERIYGFLRVRYELGRRCALGF